jgi:hypothetical protein
MGIYNDGKIYGVSLEIYDSSGNLIKQFEKTYTEQLKVSQIEEIKAGYEQFTEEEKKKLCVRFYTSISTTYDLGISDNFGSSSMGWWSGSRTQLEELLYSGFMDVII